MNPEEFSIFYNQTIQPELRRLDKERLRLLRWMTFSALVVAGVVVFGMAVKILVLALLMSIPVVLYASYLAGQVWKFRARFKPRVVRLVLDFIDDGLLYGDLKYEAEKKIPLDRFLESRLFGTARPAVYNGEDYIEGRIGDVEFELCELSVREMSRVRPRLDDVFRGIFIRAKFHRPNKKKEHQQQQKGDLYAPKELLVLPKARLPQLALALRDFVGRGGQNLDGHVRHEEFGKAYTVWGSRNTKVDDFLPVELMDFLLRYRRRKGEIHLSFYDEKAYAGITVKKDILEPRYFQSNVSYELVREFYEDIYLALHLVEAFDKSH